MDLFVQIIQKIDGSNLHRIRSLPDSLPLSEKQGIQNIFLGIKSNNVSSSFGHSFEYIFLCLRSLYNV